MAREDEVIPPASNSISAMFDKGKNPDTVAPETHAKVLDTVRAEATPSILRAKLTRGDVVFDTEHDQKVVVVEAVIGWSTKGVAFHRVTEARFGETYIQYESKLRKK